MSSLIPMQRKEYFIDRINEILNDYLMDDNEIYCAVDMYFEKSNGETQEKHLAIGKYIGE